MYIRDVNVDNNLKDDYFNDIFAGFIKVKSMPDHSNLWALLALQSKEELLFKCKILKIKGYSKLNKSDLAKLISDNILLNLPLILNKLSLKELILLGNNIPEEYSFNISQLHTISSLFTLGILHKINYNSKCILIVPSEVKSQVEKILADEVLINEYKTTSKYYNIIDGALVKFGIITFDFLEILFKECGCNSYEDFSNYALRSYEALPELEILVHPFVFDPFFIKEEVDIRHTIPYEYSLGELMSIGEDFSNSLSLEESYVYKNTLTKLNINENSSSNLIKEISFYIKNDLNFQLIIDLIVAYGANLNNEETLEEYKEKFVDFYNNSSMWILKGLTPREIEARRGTIVKKEHTIGRNEPCPCGSKKKFKKCCGK